MLQFLGPAIAVVVCAILAPFAILGFGVWAIVTAGCESDEHPCVRRA